MEVKQEPIDSSSASASPVADIASFQPVYAITALRGLLRSHSAALSSSRGRVREVFVLADSDDDNDDDDNDAAAVSSVATVTAAAGPRVKLESALIESLPPVKLEAIAVMRGALPQLSEVQLWELLTSHGHDAAAAIQAHILAQFAIGRPVQPQ